MPLPAPCASAIFATAPKHSVLISRSKTADHQVSALLWSDPVVCCRCRSWQSPCPASWSACNLDLRSIAAHRLFPDVYTQTAFWRNGIEKKNCYCFDALTVLFYSSVYYIFSPFFTLCSSSVSTLSFTQVSGYAFRLFKRQTVSIFAVAGNISTQQILSA